MKRMSHLQGTSHDRLRSLIREMDEASRDAIRIKGPLIQVFTTNHGADPEEIEQVDRGVVAEMTRAFQAALKPMIEEMYRYMFSPRGSAVQLPRSREIVGRVLFDDPHEAVQMPPDAWKVRLTPTSGTVDRVGDFDEAEDWGKEIVSILLSVDLSKSVEHERYIATSEDANIDPTHVWSSDEIFLASPPPSEIEDAAVAATRAMLETIQLLYDHIESVGIV